MPNLWGLIVNRFAIVGALVFLNLPSLLRAESMRIEGAAAVYSERDSKALLETLAIQGHQNNLRLGISRRHPVGKMDPDSPLAGNETGFTLSGEIPGPRTEEGTPTFTVAPKIGWLGSESKGIDSVEAVSRWIGTGLSFWTGEDTTRWTLNLQRTFSSTKALDVTDVDGKRILTPERIGGTSAGISWMHLATPEFLWRGSLSTIISDDRPEAHSGSLEGRYFIAPVKAAIHASIARFENRGAIRPVTLTGSIAATTASLEWHQKIGERTILAPGYRWYQETETPRAVNGLVKKLGSDQVYTTVRYRFWKDYWLEDASEFFISAGSYQTNNGLKLFHVAAGMTMIVRSI